VAISFAACIAVGFYFKGQAETGEGFFLAGREMTVGSPG